MALLFSMIVLANLWAYLVFAVPQTLDFQWDTNTDTCATAATQLRISEPPYDNYFYYDCHTQAQVVVTNPTNSSNLTYIGPRLVVAWPGGNSGVCAFFEPENGVNGTLSIAVENGTDSTNGTLVPIYNNTDTASGYPTVGVSGLLSFNSTAVLSVYVLGSIRTIRDFTEGPSILYPEIQNATKLDLGDGGTLTMTRLWLDNVTTTTWSFAPVNGNGSISVSGNQSTFEAGLYNFSASYNYPQIQQLTASETLAADAQQLIEQDVDQVTSLTFMSYQTKLLAGAWRFLTYFGRDSMITALLMQPVLSTGQGGAIEAVIGSVLERINKSDGSVCHEETIGDYATFLNMENNITSTQPQCSYPMIDTDHYLAPLMKNYFVDTVVGANRSTAFFNTTASNDFGNGNLTYGELALINAEKIMNQSVAFAAEGGQIKENLLYLKDGQVVGQWRDSTYGIGGGRVPFDVNTALVPAALRAISALAAAGYYEGHEDWNETAAKYAQVWEDETLQFFETTVTEAEAKTLIQNFTTEASLTGLANSTSNITGDITYHAIALDGYSNQSVVKIMHTDSCFRHFLLNTTNQAQLSNLLLETADSILNYFPVGLSNPVGLLIANPAYGGDPVYAANWTNNAYQGDVVWSWPMAMMAGGLERQLYRCNSDAVPDFCGNDTIKGKVTDAYNHLWDLIEDNNDQLSQEMWTWVYENDEFVLTQLGDLAPPAGVGYTESDVRQLWSLTFLAITRNKTIT